MFPLAHFLAAPGDNGVVVDAQRRVWNHEAFVDTDYAAESLASLTGSVRVVEVEKAVGRFYERDSVSFETFGVIMAFDTAAAVYENNHCIASFEISGLYRIGHSAALIGSARRCQAVDKQCKRRFLLSIIRGENVINGAEGAGRCVDKTAEPLFAVNVELR